ncbi:hypothetical protein V1634_29110 [Plantactinospora veratri]|uniref:Uncharacterized protein n=1 Tax=Plantactinospora veratri TaxID=1436122 RepID=A0ABU7SMW4_9ACTN
MRNRSEDNMPGDYNRPADERRAASNAAPVIVLRGERQVVIPGPVDDWHPTASDMWLALMDSPQASIMTSVDWAYARFCFGELSAYLNGEYASRGRTKGKSAVALETVDRLLRGVIIPPADRLRLRIAIEPPPPPAPRELTLDELMGELEAEERKLGDG